ncbi:DNA recombination protein RmuC [Escherichia coli]
MAQEAINLTRALKGDNKTQGNWGEVVLSAGAGGFRSA